MTRAALRSLAPGQRVTATLLALVALAGTASCSAETGTASQPPSASPTQPMATPSPTQTPIPTAQPEPGLLPADFTACISPGTPRPLLVQDGGLRAGAPLTITRVSLERGAGLRIADAWIAPGSATTDAASDYEWPLAAADARRLGAAWSHRRPAEGARLEPGKRYVLLLHLAPVGHPSRAGYRQVLLDYRTAAGSARGHGTVSASFGGDC